VKTFERCRTKVKDEAARKKVEQLDEAEALYDVVRAKILSDDPVSLAVAFALVAREPGVEVVTVRNRFRAADEWLQSQSGVERRRTTKFARGPSASDESEPALKLPTDAELAVASFPPFAALNVHLRLAVPSVPGGSFIVEVQFALDRLSNIDSGTKHLTYEMERMKLKEDLLKEPVYTKKSATGAAPQLGGLGGGAPPREDLGGRQPDPVPTPPPGPAGPAAPMVPAVPAVAAPAGILADAMRSESFELEVEHPKKRCLPHRKGPKTKPPPKSGPLEKRYSDME